MSASKEIRKGITAALKSERVMRVLVSEAISNIIRENPYFYEQPGADTKHFVQGVKEMLGVAPTGLEGIANMYFDPDAL